MRKKLLLSSQIIIFTIMLSACLHDDEPGVSSNVLDGDWFGYEENFSTGQVNKVSMTVLNGNVSRMSREDKGLVQMVDLDLVGTINATTRNVFAYELSDVLRTLGVFFSDQDHNYISYVDDKFNFGVLQKGTAVEAAAFEDLAAGTPVIFDINDISGGWSGYGANIRNGEMTVSSEHNSSLTVELDTLDYQGTEAGTSVSSGLYVGRLFQADVDRGLYRDNSWDNPNNVDVFGNLSMLLSPDKSYIAGRLCLPFTGVTDIEACSFLSLQ